MSLTIRKFLYHSALWSGPLALTLLAVSIEGCGESFSSVNQLEPDAGNLAPDAGDRPDANTTDADSCTTSADCDCQPGTYVAEDIDPCPPCPPGTFSDEKNAPACTPWSCDTSWKMTQQGSSTQDTRCEGSYIRQFGTPGNDYARAVAVDSEGNVYVAGEASGLLDGNRPGNQEKNKYYGNADAYIRKYDTVGQLVWTYQFGTEENDSAQALALDSEGNIYVAGFTEGALADASLKGSDAFILKLNASGEQLWARQLGGSGNDSAQALGVAADGSVYIAGYISKPPSGEVLRHSDAFLRKYGTDGAIQWTQDIVTEADDEATALAIDSSGNIYVAGSTRGNIKRPNAEGNLHGFVRKYSPDGTVQWTDQFGGAYNTYTYALVADTDGSVYAAGGTMGDLIEFNSGLSDVFIRKYNTEGELGWGKQFGGSGTDQGRALAIDSESRVYLTGFAQAPESSKADIVVIVYNSGGDQLDEEKLGSSEDDLSFAIAATPGGIIYIAGDTLGTLDGTPAGARDAFVLQLYAP